MTIYLEEPPVGLLIQYIYILLPIYLFTILQYIYIYIWKNILNILPNKFIQYCLSIIVNPEESQQILRAQILSGSL